MEATKDDLLLINRLLLDLYRVQTSDEQTESMLNVVSQLVPSLVTTSTQFNTRTRLLKFASRPAFNAPPEMLNLIGSYAHQSPFPAYFAVSGDRSWRMLTDFMPVEDFQRTDLFRILYDSIQCSHLISTMLANIGPEQYSVTLCRPSPAYTERDRAVLNLVHPHLSLSYTNAHAFAIARQSASEYQAAVELSPFGYACIRPDRGIEWITARARSLWQKSYPNDATNEAGVPTPVLAWLNESLARMDGNMSPGVGGCLKRTLGEEHLEMRLVPSPFAGSILSVELCRSNRPHFHPLTQLTVRENEVLNWMTGGKRNAEIAIILGVSPRTIEKHVEAIFTALGVENRATAIVRAMELASHDGSHI